MRLLLRFIGLLPLNCRRSIGRLLGRFVSIFPTRDRKIAALQLDHFMPDKGGRRILPEVYESIGITALETINLTPILDDLPKYVTCPDEIEVAEILSRKKPILALTAHTANWDLLGAYWVKKGVPVNAIGRVARNPRFHLILSELRSRYGVKTLWREDAEGAKEIIRAFRTCGIIAALIDQDTDVDSVYVPFFGRLAKTPSSLITLAKRYEVIIVSALIARLPDRRYEIRIREIPSEGSVSEILERFHRDLESTIRAFPSQWVWFHKRWRSSPETGTLGSKDYLNHLSNLAGHEIA